MATSLGSNTSLNLKHYIFTSATSQEKLNMPLSVTNYQSGNMTAQHSQRFNDDPLFLDITATTVTPKFAKRRQLTRIYVCTSESIHPGDLSNSCQTSRGRFFGKQVSPVCDIDLKDITPLRCDQLCAGNVLSVWVENRDSYFNNHASNSSEEENDDQYTFFTSRNETRESIPVLSPRGKSMIIKLAEKKSQGKKIKNDNDKSNICEIGEYSFDLVKWSRTIAILDEKAQHRIQNKSSEDGSHHLNDGICSNKDRHLIKGHATCTSMPTRYVKNVNVCERLQEKRSSCYDTNSTQNSNSLQFYESMKYIRKRPVMGKSAKLASIDSLSFGVLAEFKRNVHMNYGDGKRRRMKTNGILKPASSNVTIINDILTSGDVSREKLTNVNNKSHAASMPATRVISRSVGPCKKLISMRKKNSIQMKKEL